MKWQFYDDDKVFFPKRRDIRRICESLGEYVLENNIANVGFIDKSSRLAYLGLREYWHKEHPELKIPGIYFFNPLGFDSPNSVLKNKFENTFKLLMKEKDKPFLLFDSCIHTGKTAKGILLLLKKLNFEKVYFAVARNDSSGKISVKIDREIERRSSCRPFGWSDHFGIIRKEDCLVSNVNSYGLEDARRIREEFLMLLRE